MCFLAFFVSPLLFFSFPPQPPRIWIPLVNNYRSYRPISNIGEMDGPSRKQFYSQLTQNKFCILERILSNNWCLEAPFSYWSWVSLMFKKKIFGKPMNQTHIFNCRQKSPTKNNKYWTFLGVPLPRKSGSSRGLGVLISSKFLIIPTGLQRRRSLPKIAARWR